MDLPTVNRNEHTLLECSSGSVICLNSFKSIICSRKSFPAGTQNVLSIKTCLISKYKQNNRCYTRNVVFYTLLGLLSFSSCLPKMLHSHLTVNAEHFALVLFFILVLKVLGIWGSVTDKIKSSADHNSGFIY